MYNYVVVQWVVREMARWIPSLKLSTFFGRELGHSFGEVILAKAILMIAPTSYMTGFCRCLKNITLVLRSPV